MTMFGKSKTATRREWLLFTAKAVCLCGAAYLAMALVATALESFCDKEALLSALGYDAYYLIMDGGPTGFALAALVVILPFVLLSVRRLRDAGLSPYLLLLPPGLAALGLGGMLLYVCESPGFLYGDPIAGSAAAWLGMLSLSILALAAAATLALLGLMAFRRSR